MKLLLQQVYGLFWKDLIIKRRHYVSTFFEISIPLVFAYFISKSKHRLEKQVFPFTPNLTKHGTVVPIQIDPTVDFDLAKSKQSLLGMFLQLDYAPNSSQVNELLDLVNQTFAEFNVTILMNGYPSKSVLEEKRPHVHGINADQWTVLLFEDLSGLTKKYGKLTYTIGDSDFLIGRGLPSSAFGRVHFLQYVLNEEYLKKRARLVGTPDPPNLSPTVLVTHRIPSASYIYPKEEDVQQTTWTLIGYYFIALLQMLSLVLAEKETRSREMLKMSGLSDAAYWFSTISFRVLWFAMINLVMLMLCTFVYHPMWQCSSFLIIYFVFCLHAILMVLSAFIISVPFQKSTWPSIAISFWFLYTGAMKTKFNYSWITCLIPNVAFAWIGEVIDVLEARNMGLTFSTLATKQDSLNFDTVLHVVMSMIVSCFLHLLLLLYLDAVWPWQQGVPKPLHYFLTKQYWCPSKSRDSDIQMTQMNSRDENRPHFEKVDPQKPVAIECHNLTKNFSGLCSNQSNAVDNIDLSIYKGEITCLLGHNGAGKTTTMNMITGMFTPTSGSVFVNGYDLLSDTNRARESMSLCPQDNPLFPDLTLKEHLFIYSCVKGYPHAQIDSEIKRIIALFELEEHESKKPNELSGGTQRKLCLSIAIVGGSQILISDEPSAVLDVQARRTMWDALKSIRKNRTILLTTHDMEEADALSDRILIMFDGHIVGAGTSLFLKKSLGIYAMRPTSTYSGGNKRKLSIALAMIGSPKLALLDEPTAGVDPKARRKIWNSLAHIRDTLHCAMILTSHSMNECEALCSRIAIMVRGEFVCIGSAQHLKSKFGQEYTATIKIKQEHKSHSKYMLN